MVYPHGVIKVSVLHQILPHIDQTLSKREKETKRGKETKEEKEN